MPGNSPADEQALSRMLPTIVTKQAVTGVAALIDLAGAGLTGRYLTLVADIKCHILAGTGGVVATIANGLFLPAENFQDFYADGTFRSHLSVIKATGEPDGNLYIGLTSDF